MYCIMSFCKKNLIIKPFVLTNSRIGKNKAETALNWR